ncbi:hypothetical protein [Curtobacterium sp. MCSS17_016]|uniref:hypothetical protein n=1 Tax=Curtobacterium sp. MCSS17_016 TaxID=2175644 RepID=UPI000DA97551|nr:hypothetical protein [Curtobacterium sp. MCSS17_016]WIE81135.1 hypothetical protein DEJ19_021910 [Curtobacterium sp. MCSS17_016]
MRTFTITLTRYGKTSGTVTFTDDGTVTEQAMENLSGDGRLLTVLGFGEDTNTQDLSLRAFLRNPRAVVGMHPFVEDTHYGQSVLFGQVAAVAER